MMGTRLLLRVFGSAFIFLTLILVLVFLVSGGLAYAQDESFAWEGDWLMYQDLREGSTPIRIVKSSDGSYYMDVGDEDSNQSDWHPPLVITRTVTVTQYRMKIVMVSSYEGVLFNYSEMNFERTDNPSQLRGTYYFRTEHQFSGNDLGWGIVDNFIETDVVALCAAREGFQPPVPCMALGDAFVPPEEESTEDESNQGEETEEEAEDFFVSLVCMPGEVIADQSSISCNVQIMAMSEDLMDAGFTVVWQLDGAGVKTTSGAGASDAMAVADVSAGIHDVRVTVTSPLSEDTASSAVSILIEQGVSEENGAAVTGTDAGQDTGSSITPADPGSAFDTQPATSPGQVSPEAQAAAAGVTTGLLAFWWIMEFLALAPLAEAGQSGTGSRSPIDLFEFLITRGPSSYDNALVETASPPKNATSTEAAAPPSDTTAPLDDAIPPDTALPPEKVTPPQDTALPPEKVTPTPETATPPDNTSPTETTPLADAAPPADPAQATPPAQTAASQTTPVDPSRYLEVLQDKFQEIVKDKVEEGYYVRNPNLIEKIKNNFPVVSASWDYLAGLEGGQCGDFAEWGDQWIKDWAQETYGPGVVVDQIWVGESSSRYPDGLGDAVDALIQANHAATRILLPNGESVVVDFWDAATKYQINAASLPDIKPVPEAEWVYEWGGKIGTNNDPADICNVNALQEDLRSHIASFDAEHPSFAASGSQESFLENQEAMERAIESWQQENPQISPEVKQTIIQNWREHGSGWGLHRPEPPADPLTALFEEGLDLWYN